MKEITEIKCNNKTQSDCDTYTEKQYEQMEKELSKKINELIEETENRYCITAQVKPIRPSNRVEIFIWNEAIHNNPPFEIKD